MEVGTSNSLLQFAGQHLYALIIVITILVVFIIYMNSTGWRIPGRRRCTKKVESLSDEDEIDGLIESIHAKQRRKK